MRAPTRQEQASQRTQTSPLKLLPKKVNNSDEGNSKAGVEVGRGVVLRQGNTERKYSRRTNRRRRCCVPRTTTKWQQAGPTELTMGVVWFPERGKGRTKGADQRSLGERKRTKMGRDVMVFLEEEKNAVEEGKRGALS